MGNRATLVFTKNCEFEAKNCIPVTWLAMFSQEEFVVETRKEEGEEINLAIFRTNQDKALQRLNILISDLKGRTPAWDYLRPMEVLRDELEICKSDDIIELNVTEFWQISESFHEFFTHSILEYSEMINSFSGEPEHDLVMVNRLVSNYALGKPQSLAEMDSEQRMHMLIGLYWGDPNKENLYSYEFFNDAYWNSTK